MEKQIDISFYDYPLPEERIAKFPLERRDDSRLLVYRGGRIGEMVFRDIGRVLPAGALLVFNDTKVVRARIILHKESGARIEIFCLEPRDPADYERAFAVRAASVWECLVGNSKRWKGGALSAEFEYNGGRYTLTATRVDEGKAGAENGTASMSVARPVGERDGERLRSTARSTFPQPARPVGEGLVRFEWDAPLTFGQLLEHLGRVPIPPYLGRESEEIDEVRYQTVYSRFEGSVAAPTAGLHFSEELLESLGAGGKGSAPSAGGIDTARITLHVGAGTFLPVKGDDARTHAMHAEHFEVTLFALEALAAHVGRTVVVGTTTVRTLESLVALAWRIRNLGTSDEQRPIGQWELYDIPDSFDGGQALRTLIDYMRSHNLDRLKAATRIMIVPGYRFRLVDALITNFHQPRSTLLLLVGALVGDDWRRIYDYALGSGFRFLSYGDSSILFK